MAKEKAAPGEPPAGHNLVRKGLYRGPGGRSFASVPFGETLTCFPGKVYEVGEQWRYLWIDSQFAHLWDWQSEPEWVPSDSGGQVPPRA